jgi:hypothetical protein
MYLKLIKKYIKNIVLLEFLDKKNNSNKINPGLLLDYSLKKLWISALIKLTIESINKKHILKNQLSITSVSNKTVGR